MTHWKVFPLQRSLAAHAATWDRLNERLFDSHPLLTSKFVEPLLAHFGTGDEHLCIAFDADESVQSMCILRRRRAGVWASFLPSQAQIAPALLGARLNVDGLFSKLPGLVLQIELLCMDPEFGGRHVSGDVMQDHALTISIRTGTTFEDYWKGRSSKLRNNARRWERRVAEGGLERVYRVLRSPQDMQEAVKRYGELESRGWKGKTGTSLQPGGTQHAFYLELMAAFARSGTASVHELWLDSRLAASRLVITAGAVTVFLKTTYDETLQDYVPGRLLLLDVIRHLMENTSITTLEFYTDATADQRTWATHERTIRHATHYRFSWLKWLVRSFGKLRTGVSQPPQFSQPGRSG